MLEREFDLTYSREYGLVCGCDEAGRGPLAGPVVAAAVVLPENCAIDGLDDSKKLTEKKREALFDVIKEKALGYGIALCTHEEIDEMNILAASLTAMVRAKDKCAEMLEARGFGEIGLVLVDGNKSTDFGTASIPVVHGDAISLSIAAASVLAKVTRDRMMLELDRLYPGYGLAKHKGYPTAEHMLAVYELGASEIHRKTFLSFLDTKKEMLEGLKAKKAEKESREKHE